MRHLAVIFVALSPMACDGPVMSADAGTDAAIVDAGPPPPSRPAAEPLIQWVDPFLGTGGVGYNDLGNAYPGPTRPFGMARPGPDTSTETGTPGFNHCAGYSDRDLYVDGFSQTRMEGTGTPDYGHIGLMPIPAMEDAFVTQRGSRSLWVEGSREASPGYFSGRVQRGNVRTEITSTERVGIYRFTFEPGDPLAILVDIGHRLSDDSTVMEGSVAIDLAAQEVTGYANIMAGYSGRVGGVPLYFVARFDRPFAAHGVWEGTTRRDGELTAVGGLSGAWVSFDPGAGETVILEIGISAVDLAGARANLEAETVAFDFDAARLESERVWETWLSRVRVEGRDEGEFGRFYTALYHSLLMPTLATDVDGRYLGIDRAIHTASGFTYYTDFSLWDTYRSLHPLLTLLYPEAQLDFLESLSAMARDGGAMPRWALGPGYTGGMLGDPAAIVMADSYRKGLTDFDLRSGYDALRMSALGDVVIPTAGYRGRGNAEVYDRLGYVPIETGGWSASKTLEFAYADYALGHLAEALGETADAARFFERAGSWRNQWDPAREFFVGRHEDGSFATQFREEQWQDYLSEGNPRQYLWLVPHDVPGLVEQLGGRDRALERLREFFAESEGERHTAFPPVWYWQGNEPDMHAAYLFTALGEPRESARWARWVAGAFYGDGPGGLPGNDDGGTMSAWLVFTYLGFFPFAGEDDYLLGSPFFTRAELAIGGGTFVIEAPESSTQEPIVTEAAVDSTPLTDFRLPHALIQPGSSLHLTMGPDT